MACIEPDGSLTLTGRLLLEELIRQPLSPQGIAKALEQPVFTVRARIREMVTAELIEERGGEYFPTEKGKGLI